MPVGPLFMVQFSKLNLYLKLKSKLYNIICQAVFFSGYRRISADFPRILTPLDQYKSGEKVDQYVEGYAFYKHPKW